MRSRLFYGATALVVIVAGLVWRLVPLGLPVFFLRHGGAALWGAMVYLLVCAVRPGSWGRPACFGAATVIAVAAEVFRLYHAPSLDAFRGTVAGALIFGRVFSPWNILACEVGIVAAVLADRALRRDAEPPA